MEKVKLAGTTKRQRGRVELVAGLEEGKQTARMNSSEIRTAVGALDKARTAHDTGALRDILEQLDSGLVATENLLRETKVGVHVNKLRTYEDAEVAGLVKKIIKKWKDQVSADKKKRKPGVKKEAGVGAAGATGAGDEDGGQAKAAVEAKTAKTAGVSDDAGASGAVKGPRTPLTDGVKIETYPDSTRNRSISALYTAVAVDTAAAAGRILETCTAIEAAIFAQNKDKVNDAYRNKLRSLILNMKNKNNPQLRANVLDGTIPPAKLTTMSSAELAPESLKKELEQLHQKNLFDAQGAVEKRAVTDRFVCGKCKQRQVSYYQMQTRSADEPLTTFCTCEKCGNRWKFC